MKGFKLAGLVFVTAILGMSAQAACGGGGYKPQSQTSASAPSDTRYASQSDTRYAPQTDTRYVPQADTRYESRSDNRYESRNDSRTVSGRNSSSFDASSFHSISGRLHLSGEQASSVISMIQDVRRMDGTPNFDAKAEFEKRLASILNPEQMRTYQDSMKRS